MKVTQIQYDYYLYKKKKLRQTHPEGKVAREDHMKAQGENRWPPTSQGKKPQKKPILLTL